MIITHGLFTSESVSPGHPDKLCDRISDAILDRFLTLDPSSRVACETLATNERIIVAGEFRTTDPSDFYKIEREAEDIVRQTLRSVGYGSREYDIDPQNCDIEILFNRQSSEIAAGVDREGKNLGAGDQGIMFGYACDETPALMPLAWSLATDLVAAGASMAGPETEWLRPDGKSQVTVRYENGLPVGVQSVVLSWQHSPQRNVEEMRDFLTRYVVDQVIPKSQRTADFRVFLNPAGSWTTGGPKGDCGLTGRKIIVDTYGGACAHGGGAFSGKDPSKVDRSAAYAARYIAKHVVAAGLARRCTVQLSYAIGHDQPVSVAVSLHGTGYVSETVVERAICQIFDLSPAGIIRELDLLRPVYTSTSSLGHFGKYRNPMLHRWEATPKVAELADLIATMGEQE